MLKFAFWVLLAANIMAFASALDFSGTSGTRTASTETTPVLPERIRILPQSAAPVQAPKPASGQDMPKKTAVSCIAFEGFDSENADRFEKKLAFPAGTFKRTIASTPSSYMVYIPPSKTMKAAEARIAELKAKHITNYFLIQDGKFRNAISLGIFKTEASAKKLLAELETQGIRDLAIAGRGKQTETVTLGISNPDRHQLERIDALLPEFPQITRKDCPLQDAATQ